MLPLIARRSTCARRQVAAILTDLQGRVLSTGYNGVPRSHKHCTTEPCMGAKDEPGNTENCMAVHAEMNALLQAGDRLQFAYTLYCTCFPCFGCAKAIANTPIVRIVYSGTYADHRGYDVLRHLKLDLL